jgi:hypothetical protein
MPRVQHVPKANLAPADGPIISLKEKIYVSFGTVPGLSSKYQQSKLDVVVCLANTPSEIETTNCANAQGPWVDNWIEH